MNVINFLIKPASGRCNIACRYCFYRDVTEHREQSDYGIMTDETAGRLISRAMEDDPDAIVFGFQGGEPILAGLPFFERFVEKVREEAEKLNATRPGRTLGLHFALQTNGVAINEAWARFFKKENFLIGISIDGPRILHDSFRVRRDDSGTYAAVMEGAAKLRAENVPVNALCVVDAAVADNAVNVYKHLRSRGFDWIQFIPCLDPLGEEPGGRSWSLTPEKYSRFLKETFDLRYSDWKSGIPVNVRWIDNLISMAMGYAPESCGMRGFCAANFTVEADGSVYPCDFYVTDEWKLGNVHADSLAVMRETETARRFVEESNYKDPECGHCFAYPLCRGGCRRDREPFKDGRPVRNRYCSSFREFFTYAGERIMEMARFEKEALALKQGN